MDIKYRKAPEKKKLEEEIEKLAADYFTLKKQSGVDDACKDAKNKLMTSLLEYFKNCQKNFFRNFNEFHSNVLTEEINFESSQGMLWLAFEDFFSKASNEELGITRKFLPYFMVSMKKDNFKNICMEEYRPNRIQMNDYLRIRNQMNAKGLDEKEKKDFFEMAEILGWGDDRIEAAWAYGKSTLTNSLSEPIKTGKDSDGAVTLEDMIEDNTIEKINSEKEKQIERLAIIEKCFMYRHVKQNYTPRNESEKPYLSALLTHYFLDDLFKIDKGILKKFSFVDMVLIEEIARESRINPSYKMLRKDVAARFGKDETDASRKMEKQFIPYLKEEIELSRNGE